LTEAATPILYFYFWKKDDLSPLRTLTTMSAMRTSTRRKI